MKYIIKIQIIVQKKGRQCRDRYMNYLFPGFFNGQWSKKEDELLLSKYIELGPKWSKIKDFFLLRSANSIKNRWNYYVKKNLYYNEINKNTVQINENNLQKEEFPKYNNETFIKSKEIENINDSTSSNAFFTIYDENKFDHNEQLYNNNTFVLNEII